MTENVLALLRVDRGGRVRGMSGEARAVFGSVTCAMCADVVRAEDRRGRLLCVHGCASRLVESGAARFQDDASVRGRAARIRCEPLGDELIVMLTLGGAAGERLTARERAVLTLVAEGLTEREIAQRLAIRTSTARTHVQHIRDKLGAKTRAQAVALARPAKKDGEI